MANDINKVYLVGTLKSKDLRDGLSSSDIPYKNGTLVLQIKGENEVTELQVKVLQSMLKKDGSENALYKALETIDVEYKTIAENGDEADRIEIRAKIKDNAYVNKSGEIVDAVEISAFTISRTTSDIDVSELQIEGVIKSSKMNGDDLDVELIVPEYNGNAFPLKTVVKDDLVEGAKPVLVEGAAVVLSVEIKNTVVIKEVDTQPSFGKSFDREVKSFVREYKVVGGSPSKNTYDISQLAEALKLRMMKLESKKAGVPSQQTQGFSTFGK